MFIYNSNFCCFLNFCSTSANNLDLSVLLRVNSAYEVRKMSPYNCFDVYHLVKSLHLQDLCGEEKHIELRDRA